MKILKNIHQVLLYYHLCGDIDITKFLYILRYDDIDRDEYVKLGYNIYYDNACPEALVKNSTFYEIMVNNIDMIDLYNYLNNNKFIKSKFNVKLGKTKLHIDYKYIVASNGWDMIYLKYNTLDIKDSFITFY